MINLNSKYKKICEFNDCNTIPIFDIIGGNGRFCIKHKLPNMINIKSKTCEQEGCLKKGPVFNIKGQKGRFCEEHKLPEMINVVSKRCKFEDCDLLPSFGSIKGISIYCVKHKLPGMINVLTKLCTVQGCTIRGNFGMKNNKPSFCINHKEKDMIDVSRKNCIFNNCNTRPAFGTKGGEAEYCYTHKLNNMINVISKKCEYIGCDSTSPSYNFKGKSGMYCTIHKEQDMIDVRHKKCIFQQCTIIPTFALKGNKAEYCKIHKLDNMIDVDSNKCEYNGCNTCPVYGLNIGKAQFCLKHKEFNMFNVKDKQCEYTDCSTRAYYGIPGNAMTHCFKHREKGMIRRSNGKCLVCKIPAFYGKNFMPIHCEIHKKEDEQNLIEMPCISCNLIMILDKNNKCEYCNPEIFKRNQLVKQNALMDYLDNRNLTGKSTDRIINNGECGKERPDRIYELKDKIIILECDENQHNDRQCSCEQIRMVNIGQSYGGTPVYFIRWNPDDYLPENEKKEPEIITKRYKLLGDLLDSIIKGKMILPIALVSVLYMYYDGWSSFAEEEWKIITPLN
jgi:hypothetical protein